MKMLFLLLITFSMFLCSCAVFKTPVFQRMDKFELRDLTADHTSMDLSLVIANPNWYAITIKSLDVIVTDVNADKLGDIKMSQQFRVEKHSADTVYFQIQADTRKVAKLVSHSAQKVVFIVKADAKAKVLGIPKRIKITQPQSINLTQLLEQMLPSIPSDILIPTISTRSKGKILVATPVPNTSPIKMDIFKVLKTSITDIGFTETELTVSFLLLNPYGLGFTLRDFPSEIRVNDNYAGKGRLMSPLFFDENVFQAEGKLVFRLNNFSSIKLASSALMKKDMDYRVDGTLMVDGFGTKISKPFRFHGTVEIGKKDKE